MTYNPFEDATKLGAIIDDLRKVQDDAQEAFERGVLGFGDPSCDRESDAAWWIEMAFLKLLAATEALKLDSLKTLVLEDIRAARASDRGFTDSEPGPEEPYPLWLSRQRQYVLAIETLGGLKQEQAVTKDLTEILRATEYPITDVNLFGSVPESEEDVHRRIEGILRCVFPDLKHKPTLTKPIKNFEPDTGLPGIRTLIEYKYVAQQSHVPIIADQILADTRGYSSRDWRTFIYVIYETRRFRPEHEWVQLLRDCGVPSNTSAIVLSGEPIETSERVAPRARNKRTA